MLRELGMRNAIYSPDNYGPDEEVFTTGMRNIVLQTAPTSLFGSLVAIVSPHLGHPISEMTRTVADLGEAETTRIQKEIRPVTYKKNLQGPMKVTRTQMWVDLIQAGADGKKLDGKSNRILPEQWHQLKPEQQFQSLRPKRQRSETEPQVWPVCLQDFLLRE